MGGTGGTRPTGRSVDRSRGPKRSTRLWWVLATLIALVLLAAACGEDGDTDGADDDASADDAALDDWEPEWVDGVLQPLPTGWPSDDDRLTLVNRGAPGDRNTILMESLLEAAQPRSPAAITIDMESGGGGHGSYAVQAETVEQHPDGSQLMIVSMSGSISTWHQEPIEEDTGVNYYDDFEVLVRLEGVPYVMVQSTDAPWGRDWLALADYAQENPGEIRYMSSARGGGIDVVVHAVLTEMGVPVEEGFIQQIPLGGQDEAVLAVAAGEGHFAMTDGGRIRPHWEAGQVDAAWTTSVNRMEPFDSDENFTTAEDLGLTQIYQTDLGLIINSDAPEAHKAWWEELLREASSDPDYIASREAAIPGVEVGFWDRGRTAEHQQFLYDLTGRVLRDLEMHKEQQ